MAMKFQREAQSDFAISAYSPQSISVGGIEHHHSLCVSHLSAATRWSVNTFTDIDAVAIAAAIAVKPELVIVGTGRMLRFPPPTAMQPLMEARIGFEVMDTAAACRTYNVLLSEGRQVAALLLIE